MDYAFAEPRPMKARQAAFRLEFKVYRTEDMPANWFKTYDGFYVTRRIDNNWVYGQHTMDGMNMTDILVGSIDPSTVPELNEAYTYVPPGAAPVYMPPLPPGMTQPVQTITVQIPNETPQSIPQRVKAPVRLRTRDPYELAKTGTPDELRAAVNAGVNFNVKISEFYDNGELNPDVSYEFGNGETPLHYAAYYNHNPESIRFLIEQGLDVNGGFSAGNAIWGDVLSLAVINKNIGVIYELLRHGADPKTTLHYNGIGTPLHVIAARYKEASSVTRSIIEAIINAGGDINFHEEFENLSNVLPPRNKWKSSDPMENMRWLSHVDSDGFIFSFTPLMFAALYDNADAVDVLLDHNADVNIRNAEGKTALDYANELPADSAIKRSDAFNRLRAATRR